MLADSKKLFAAERTDEVDVQLESVSVEVVKEQNPKVGNPHHIGRSSRRGDRGYNSKARM